MNYRLKKLVSLRLEEELNDSFFILFANEIWIVSDNKTNWYFKISSDGQLDYNQKFISGVLNLFTLSGREINKFLKDWFEDLTKLKVRVVRRINSDLDWIIEKIYKEPIIWDTKNRNGFGYEIIKKFLTLSEKYKIEKIRIENLKPQLEIFSKGETLATTTSP